jgi:hypothetical protein
LVTQPGQNPCGEAESAADIQCSFVFAVYEVCVEGLGCPFEDFQYVVFDQLLFVGVFAVGEVCLLVCHAVICTYCGVVCFYIKPKIVLAYPPTWLSGTLNGE